ncbi:hypothetical protein PFICI_10622 [Pestalotiopsis fici W106-1]|uniref:Uncharacterized protein n=1 Tax=Pestalotiopsis fici (strain W106-1 / CGMCC3.15140) TaxID=1229662 RepID=W3WXJ0_PESFW|nr:uncharacterized protein PFICI_10622 [Pestalotiopsis fici W106-1]ETS78560.1 hypothetical protein PFICI_10622 [Pestalotiopsis fici W106-1]
MQGFNMGRYVPPDLEGTVSGNKLHKKHPLGSRASKPGALTVRFEMPFAVWCGTCPKPTIIGQGVRFNAAKSRVGSYYSTPIFAFRMKHADCGGTIEVRTDPQNTAYVVTEGGRRRDDAEGKVREGDLEILTDAEREKLRNNSFARLEKTIEDREQLIVGRQRVEELQETNNRTWEDPYEMNRRLRKEFRVGRHEREKDALKTEELKDKLSLGIELVAEREEDKRRAGLIDFGSTLQDGREDDLERKGLSRPLFDKKAPRPKNEALIGAKRLKSEVKAEQTKDNLVSELVGNTRVVTDPFLNLDRSASVTKASHRMPGIKRKRVEDEDPETGRSSPEHKVKRDTASVALVSYDSDTD